MNDNRSTIPFQYRQSDITSKYRKTKVDHHPIHIMDHIKPESVIRFFVMNHTGFSSGVTDDLMENLADKINLTDYNFGINFGHNLDLFKHKLYTVPEMNSDDSDHRRESFFYKDINLGSDEARFIFFDSDILFDEYFDMANEGNTEIDDGFDKCNGSETVMSDKCNGSETVMSDKCNGSEIVVNLIVEVIQDPVLDVYIPLDIEPSNDTFKNKMNRRIIVNDLLEFITNALNIPDHITKIFIVSHRSPINNILCKERYEFNENLDKLMNIIEEIKSSVDIYYLSADSDDCHVFEYQYDMTSVINFITCGSISEVDHIRTKFDNLSMEFRKGMLTLVDSDLDGMGYIEFDYDHSKLNLMFNHVHRSISDINIYASIISTVNTTIDVIVTIRLKINENMLSDNEVSKYIHLLRNHKSKLKSHNDFLSYRKMRSPKNFFIGESDEFVRILWDCPKEKSLRIALMRDMMIERAVKAMKNVKKELKRLMSHLKMIQRVIDEIEEVDEVDGIEDIQEEIDEINEELSEETMD